jgi:hypothetical protein
MGSKYSAIVYMHAVLPNQESTFSLAFKMPNITSQYPIGAIIQK